ncbi:MHC class II regulatory factor RFX1 [Liparis tanakae]|uniref:MHC class II regulatory factor RFX1 n=1 Tax=Liparis tanakae TaxID=230148 RepID=A0A4Z2HWS5_9TELE|nr:MHC class II regulatory factor RFX1 [Liparis tanakae]
MATSGYSEDLQPQQANTVTIATPPATTTSSSAKTAHFLSEMPPTSGTVMSAAASKTGQGALCPRGTPIGQKAAVLTAPTQHYGNPEVQHSAAQKSNGQSNSPQYIIVTVTEGSVHSNDSLSDSSPPAPGVATQVVQPVESIQQRSVLQAVSQAAKRIHSGHINNLQSVHIRQEVEHVYSGQVQYVDGGGDVTFTTSSIRSSNYPFSDSPLYSQAPPTSSSSYYEPTPSTESDISGSVTSQPVSVATAGANCGGAGAGGGGYVIQGGYMLGGGAAGGGGGGGGGQTFSNPNSRAPPATVQWLCDNYEGAEGVSLPRCTLYYHYLLHCQEQKLEPVNAASFGKLIRHNESEKRLPKACLVVLCKYEPVLRWTKECDNLLYQTLVEILVPDVLRPIPSALTQAIRNFAKSLENWLTGAMMNIPEEMVRIKVVCIGSFSQTLRRYTSLNHLAQAARAVLQNTAQINQMLSDLNRVDFTNVQEQASWVCQCEDRVVQQLEQDFKMTLQQQNSLEQWATWLDGVVSEALKPYEHNPAALPKAAKVFLLNWSFYSSMVIRDLTLRSAASFGSFHLIRLLYDEYMYYLIEHRVAQAKGVTPIAVMGEVGVCKYSPVASVCTCTAKSRISRDLEKEEEEDDEEEESEDEGGDLVLQSSSLSAMDDEKDPMEPPAKLPRTTFNLHTLTDGTQP